MISPEIIASEGRKETPQVKVVEVITRNIKVVEIDGLRKYQVVWKSGIAGVEGVTPPRKGEPVISYFDTAEQVIHQHERVLENYLGVQIPLAAGKILTIPGEAQKMAKISQELSSLAGQFVIPFTPQASAQLKEKTAKIKEEIGRVTNVYKLKTQAELAKAFLSEDEQKAAEAVLSANLAILERAKESLGIVSGTNSRLRRVTNRRNEWEQVVNSTFYEMAQIVKNLENGVYTDHPRKREQLARHLSGESEYSLLGKLNLISGPEYYQRIQSREVQRLGEVGDLLRKEKDERVRTILFGVILKLERVIKEKEERKS